ncbi:MAG: NAD-dependent epimerase/dehydratase family protein [Waddliaceae bacterium]
MNILITGGTGFIGSQLALKCLEKGYTVKVLGQENTEAESENTQLIKEKGAEIILGSVIDKKLLEKIVEGIDIVFHLAAAQHEMNVPDKRYWDVNVEGCRNMLEASIGGGVKRFVHGSTIGVYGSALSGDIDEKSLLAPNNIYGETKLAAEKLVLSFQEKLPVSIIRISETYGPGDRRLLKLFKAIKKNVFFIIGNGENIHHLIYIDDLIEGLFLAATLEAAVGKIFVLAGKDTATTNMMAEVIAKQLGTRVPKFHAPLSLFLLVATIMELSLRPLGIQPPLHRRRMDFFRKSFSFSRDASLRSLNFSPRLSFAEGVERTAKWYQEQGLL